MGRRSCLCHTPREDTCLNCLHNDGAPKLPQSRTARRHVPQVPGQGWKLPQSHTAWRHVPQLPAQRWGAEAASITHRAKTHASSAWPGMGRRSCLSHAPREDTCLKCLARDGSCLSHTPREDTCLNCLHNDGAPKLPQSRTARRHVPQLLGQGWKLPQSHTCLNCLHNDGAPKLPQSRTTRRHVLRVARYRRRGKRSKYVVFSVSKRVRATTETQDNVVNTLCFARNRRHVFAPKRGNTLWITRNRRHVFAPKRGNTLWITRNRRHVFAPKRGNTLWITRNRRHVFAPKRGNTLWITRNRRHVFTEFRCLWFAT